uniref:Cytochrome c biogenesis protein CcsA n=1 Tax=Aphanochaete elegans TaxID=764105 RepID=A0A6H1XDS9_9CHLO|nr:heme attachment to plastid cytochrome c [Aphanochaete elegans]QJA13754.1 heme attachment to plastid cytochrome c [Aphanochaete elegans]
MLNLENFMANLSFCLLFVTMLFYWIFNGFARNPQMQQLGTLGMFFANLSLLIVLLIRWIESGHFPLSNLYESLLFLSWSLTFLHLSIETTNYTNNNNKSTNIDLSFIGTITAPSALLTSSFANFSLPIEMQKSSALVPALQSNWLIMHVTIMILSYAALILGCLLAIAFLIVTRAQDINLTGNSFGNISGYYNNSEKIILNVNNVENLSTNINKQINKDSGLAPVIQTQENNLLLLNSSYNLAKSLDNLSYRILGLGFPLLTIGILSGSVWANEAWGSYWSWDPKETWALLTWLVFAIYLHTRITKGWQGKKPALIASFGFIIVWVCFIGVNLLGKGLHSYGWVRLF